MIHDVSEIEPTGRVLSDRKLPVYECTGVGFKCVNPSGSKGFRKILRAACLCVINVIDESECVGKYAIPGIFRFVT